jgi:Terpene synthase family 2, C-terminal metal binding
VILRHHVALLDRSPAQDIVSYHLEESRGNKHNLVAVLIAEHGFSVQSAVNFAAKLVKQTIDTFITTEQLLPVSFSNRVGVGSPAWPSKPSSFHPWDRDGERDIRLYVQGVRDCVAAFINWMYETELFFGKKGSEVRSFGWIFLTAGVDKSSDS